MGLAKLKHIFPLSFCFPVVKNLPANAGDIRDAGSVPGQEDPLEEGMATHASAPAWESPRTEKLVGYSPWAHKQSAVAQAT